MLAAEVGGSDADREMKSALPLAALAALLATAPLSAQVQDSDTAPLASEPAAPLPPPINDDLAAARQAAASGDSAEALARFLRVLATKPRDLEALTGAGKAALDIGDANGALNFYARAEEIAPGNGRVKAGLGAAMVQLQQPQHALRFFDEAIRFGVPPLDIAADRGLAHDLRGDGKRARMDYDMLLRARPGDPEATRRLAASLAISGDTVGAIAALDPLLRSHDQAAWRMRAFVLAISGDVKGAQDTANAVLPRGQANALTPFFQRLPKLKPAQQAAAVHLGVFPSDGRSYSDSELLAAIGPGADPVPSPSNLKRAAERAERERAERQIRERAEQAERERAERAERERLERERVAQERLAAASAPAPSSSPASPPPATASASVASPTPRLAAVLPSAPAAKAVPPTRLADAKTTEPKPAAKPVGKPVEEKKKPDKPVVDKNADKLKDDKKKPVNEKTKDANAKDAKASSGSKSREPERYWVQIATGAYKPDLGKEWAKLKAKYPALLGRWSPWTTPLNRTNRLMIGPFKTGDEAQVFVNKAAGSGFMTSPVKTSAGQAVERVAN